MSDRPPFPAVDPRKSQSAKQRVPSELIAFRLSTPIAQFLEADMAYRGKNDTREYFEDLLVALWKGDVVRKDAP